MTGIIMVDSSPVRKPYIMLPKDLFSDKGLQSKQPFSKREAWLYILIHASCQAETFGEFEYTERSLALVFNWPSPTLRYYIRKLIDQSKIEAAIEADVKQHVSRIRVLNYSTYSGSVSNIEADVKHQVKQQPLLTISPKEDLKNEEEESITPTPLKKRGRTKSPKLSVDEVMSLELPPSFGPQATAALRRWAEYKQAKRQTMIRVSWESEIEHYAKNPRAFVEDVDYTIRKGYQGLVSPKASNGGKSKDEIARDNIVETLGIYMYGKEDNQ